MPEGASERERGARRDGQECVTAWLPVELHRALVESAESQDRSMSGEVRHALRVYLRQMGKSV